MKQEERSGLAGISFRFTVSAFVTVVLALQLVAGFGKSPREWWPFLQYPMYRTVRSPSEEIPRFTVYGIRPDSSEIILGPDDFGLNFQKFRQGVVGAMLAGDEDGLRRYFDLYRVRHEGADLAAVRLQRRAAKWENGEFVWLPDSTVATLELSP